MNTLYTKLKNQFSLGEYTTQRDNLLFITVKQNQLRPLMLHLRDSEGFTHLVLLTAVDWIEDNHFQLTYLLSNRKKQQDIGLKIKLSRDEASMESMHELWPTIATYQRELHEMFGIDFPNSPGVKDDFILEGWNDLPPYRRDFNTLEYAQKTYRDRPGRESKDPAQHMKEQLYPSRDGSES